MEIEIKVPSLGESENEATLVSWLKSVGDDVLVDDILAEIESDKITMEITAFEAGALQSILKEAGSIVKPDEVIGLLETSAERRDQEKLTDSTKAVQSNMPEADSEKEPQGEKNIVSVTETASEKDDITTARKTLHERSIERLPMSRLRKRIALHLKESQNTAAMLTTFNEVNMQYIMDIRTHHKDAFINKYGVKLGLMSFFVKACVHAAQKYPLINAYIDGGDILYHNYMDIGIAVSTPKGLVVPILKDAGLMDFADIEQGIVKLATKAREGGLLPNDLQGGTFTITNGGVFGSMLSTPILNAPQSAILGMHTIQKRVMVEHDQMVIRPMMYLALSYDHRLIDGKEAVGFLVAVKEALEGFGGILLDV